MIETVKKLHLYAGLMVFSQLIIYGIAGVVASLQTSQIRPDNPRAIWETPFSPPPNSSDKQVADMAFNALRLPLVRPMPEWAIRRTPNADLRLDFYNVNGVYRVTVLESQRKLHVEDIRNSLWHFMADIHAATPGDAEAPPLVRAWAVWNEVAMWSLLAFCLSGLYLWFAIRPRYIWAWICLAAASAAFTLIWLSLR